MFTNSQMLFILIYFYIYYIPNLLADVINCNHQIYCSGELLHTIQMARIFSDSKTFVDMSLTDTEETIIQNFKMLMGRTQNFPSRENITEFIVEHFHNSLYELETWYPNDYQPSPPFLARIKHKAIKQFAKFLVDIWPLLGRKIRNEVFQNPHQFSIIPVKNGFIVPGGRFREFYYWDSYWIIKGLLISNMKHTARGMLDNFFQIVNTYGFVPNGGRIYYLDRSQPPVLTMMAFDYLTKTSDSDFIKKNLKTLEKELKFWINHRLVNVTKNGHTYALARYHSASETPRPESYYEDVHTASIFQTKEAKRKCYLNLRTGAETGWDFSARWIFQDGNIGKNLAFTEPTRLLPVDLNAFLCKSFKLLSDLFAKFWFKDKAKYWLEKSREFQEAIDELLYDPEDGVWYDYDLYTGSNRKFFFASNLIPLWTESYNITLREEFGRNATNYLIENGILNFRGGFPASLSESGQQWDSPNAWAPLQVMLILGMEQTKQPDAVALARIFAKRWLECVEKVSRETSEMFEKYNAAFDGRFGHGGEYEVQTGFGWTNGGVLELIEYYFVKNNIDLELNI